MRYPALATGVICLLVYTVFAVLISIGARVNAFYFGYNGPPSAVERVGRIGQWMPRGGHVERMRTIEVLFPLVEARYVELEDESTGARRFDWAGFRTAIRSGNAGLLVALTFPLFLAGGEGVSYLLWLARMRIGRT